MTNPRNELRHEYSDQDALMNHGILGARWAAIQHEDEIKHYGVKGMKWGVRKDRERSSDGRTTRTTVESTRVSAHEPYAVPAGGGGGLSEDEGLSTEEREKLLKEISDDPMKLKEFNKLMGTVGIDDEVIKSVAGMTSHDGYTRRSVTSRELAAQGLDSKGRLPSGLTPVEEKEKKRRETMESVAKTLEPVVNAGKDAVEAVRRRVSPTKAEQALDKAKDIGNSVIKSGSDFLEDLKRRK